MVRLWTTMYHILTGPQPYRELVNRVKPGKREDVAMAGGIRAPGWILTDWLDTRWPGVPEVVPSGIIRIACNIKLTWESIVTLYIFKITLIISYSFQSSIYYLEAIRNSRRWTSHRISEERNDGSWQTKLSCRRGLPYEAISRASNVLL